jgi:hypothetical protein
MLLIVAADSKGKFPSLIETASVLGWNIYYGCYTLPKRLLRSPGAVYGNDQFCSVIAKDMNWKLLSNNDNWLSTVPEEYAVKDAGNITSKYRCFVKDRIVVSSCCYWLKSFKMTEAEFDKQQNYDNNHEAVVEVLNKALQDERLKCAQAAAIDVARFKKDTYTIIGSSPAWSSDIYGCEMVGVLDAIKTACVSKEEK